jgi:hypothetical protein
VITSTLERSASRTAASWLSASVRPVRVSTHGAALAASISGQGGRHPPERPSEPARAPCGSMLAAGPTALVMPALPACGLSRSALPPTIGYFITAAAEGMSSATISQ